MQNKHGTHIYIYIEENIVVRSQEILKYIMLLQLLQQVLAHYTYLQNIPQ